MILPVAFAPRQKHQSARPQGLILDSPCVSKIDVEVHALSVGHKSSHNVDDLDGQLCEISISHDGDFAIAVALVPSMSEQPMDEGISEASRP
jgi:holo-[acyl-carrier protein] synthase